MTAVPDLVRISKLDTQFYSDPEYTQHVKYVSRSSTKQRSVRKEEKWKRERTLGQGGSGIVWLERCIEGESKGEVRAVKKFQKLEASDYYRELDAIALFSQTMISLLYERCFVKSFGWYDDDDSISITMEYLPNGDLHQYLDSPLPEKESQQIVLQILEGLHFMHDIGFAHRDLKPANILIVCKGPDWWVKIADFGISKRATEGHTELRTQIGTPAFAAPEVLGHFQLDDTSIDSYTNAVDIWSLGVMIFLILTGKPPFKDQRRLGQYVAGSFKFPLELLIANNISTQGCDFVRSLLASRSEDRPTVKECLHSPWLHDLVGAFKTQTRNINISNSSPTLLNHLEPEPSASWSTQDQISAHETHRSRVVRAESATSASSKTTAQPTSQLATNIYWKLERKLKGHSYSVLAVAFSPDGKQIASGSVDHTVRLWDSAIGAACGVFKGHSDTVWAVAFSPDGKQIASGSVDHTVRLWDSATGAACGVLKGHSDTVRAIAFSPDGKQIASVSYDRTVRLWDSATGTACGVLKGHLNEVRGVAFSPDGKQIASASNDHTVRLWDSATGTACGVLKGHLYEVRAVAFSPDGKQIASASFDHTVRLWDSATGAACGVFKGHSDTVWAVAFSPDGKQIASASYDRTVRLWDSATGAACDTLEGHSRQVMAVAFSPDGKQIASGSSDGTVRLWDLATGAACGVLKGHLGRVWAVAFSPDGKQIASAGLDHTIRLWGLATGAAPPEKGKTVSEYFKKLFK